MAYSLQQSERKNYMEIRKVQLPHRTQQNSKNDLYAVEAIVEETQDGKVKVHYAGYGKSDDEWLDKDETLQLPKPVEGALYIDKKYSGTPL